MLRNYYKDKSVNILIENILSEDNENSHDVYVKALDNTYQSAEPKSSTEKQFWNVAYGPVENFFSALYKALINSHKVKNVTSKYLTKVVNAATENNMWSVIEINDGMDSYTLLDAACWFRKYPSLVEALLKGGANPNQYDKIGYLPAYYLLSNNSQDASKIDIQCAKCLKILIDNGFDFSLPLNKNDNETALDKAKKLKFTRCVKVLTSYKG